MDATTRFSELVRRRAVPLDEAALAIAAHARPDLDPEVSLAALDELAARCPEPTFAGLATHLFAVEGFRGNAARYADPANSLLDRVLARRLGIPITLCVVMVEVGRRIGVEVVPIGMPGHFLARDGADAASYCDPFHRGRLLDVAGCAAVFDRVHRGQARFDPSLLVAVDGRAVLARVLANLERTALARDPVALDWMLRLHLAIPGLPPRHRAELAARLGRVGRYAEAAATLDAIASSLPDADGRALREQARALRSRLN